MENVTSQTVTGKNLAAFARQSEQAWVSLKQGSTSYNVSPWTLEGELLLSIHLRHVFKKQHAHSQRVAIASNEIIDPHNNAIRYMNATKRYGYFGTR